MKFPVDFTEKAKLPASADGSGYPFKISANDLMRDFHYAALDAEEGWIENKKDSLWEGRKLKFPKIPEGSANKYYILAANAGDLEFLEFEMIEVSICQNNEEKTGKILFKGTA